MNMDVTALLMPAAFARVLSTLVLLNKNTPVPCRTYSSSPKGRLSRYDISASTEKLETALLLLLVLRGLSEGNRFPGNDSRLNYLVPHWVRQATTCAVISSPRCTSQALRSMIRTIALYPIRHASSPQM